MAKQDIIISIQLKGAEELVSQHTNYLAQQRNYLTYRAKKLLR